MHIIPTPKSCEFNHLNFDLKKSLQCYLGDFSPDLLEHLKKNLNISEISLTDNPQSLIKFNKKKLKNEEYELKVDNEQIEINAQSNIGAFYAIKTLKQLKEKNLVVGCEIKDYPDLEVRGVMLDISRSKVPTVKTLKKLIDLFADLKYNQLQLYVEGFSFEYVSFEEFLRENNYLRLDEIKEIEDYANLNYIDLVPNQNGFGHMTEWLKTKKYQHLAECPEGFYIWGSKRLPSTLDPTNPGSVKLVKKMYDDMLPHFKSTYFNMNFDEPYELGFGHSKDLCEKSSKEDVYIDYLLPLYRYVKKYKKTPMIWGDVLIKHPEVFDRLPKDLIFIDWGYNLNYDFSKHAKALKEKNIKFMMAPGTSTWSTITSRYDDMVGSMKNSTKALKENNGLGMLITDWGDIGHLQYLPFSYPGFIFGAQCSWSSPDESVIIAYLEKLVGTSLAKAILSLAKYTTLEGEYRDYGSRLFSLILWAEHARTQDEPIEFYISRIKSNLLTEDKLKKLEKLFNDNMMLIKNIDTLEKGEIENSINLLLTLIDIQRNLRKVIYNHEYNVFEKDLLILDAFMKKHKELWYIRNIEPGYIQSSNRIQWLIDILIQIDGRRK